MHRNKVNGKVYIGITCQSDDPNKRWQNGKHYETNKHFTSAIQKYGWDSFEHIILQDQIQSESEATALEKEAIDKHNATNREYGYNVLEGGKGYHSGYKMTPEHKQHMMESKDIEKASKNAKERWCEHHDELVAKMKESREKTYQELLKKPIGKINISKGGSRKKGTPFVAEIYFSVTEAAITASGQEILVRKAKRTRRHIKKGQIDFTWDEEPWCFLEDCFSLNCFAEFNPIIKLNAETKQIVKIYKTLRDAKRSTRLTEDEFLYYLSSRKIYRDKYFWWTLRDYLGCGTGNDNA